MHLGLTPHAKKVNEGFPRGQGKRLLRIIIFLGLFKKFVIKTQGGLIQFFKKLFIGFSFIHSFIF